MRLQVVINLQEYGVIVESGFCAGMERGSVGHREGVGDLCSCRYYRQIATDNVGRFHPET